LERASNAAQLEVARKVASRPRRERPVIDVTPEPPLVPEPLVIMPPIPTTAADQPLLVS
jgi:hypothetical protein